MHTPSIIEFSPDPYLLYNAPEKVYLGKEDDNVIVEHLIDIHSCIEKIARFALATLMCIASLGLYMLNDSASKFIVNAFKGKKIVHVEVNKKDFENQQKIVELFHEFRSPEFQAKGLKAMQVNLAQREALLPAHKDRALGKLKIVNKEIYWAINEYGNLAERVKVYHELPLNTGEQIIKVIAAITLIVATLGLCAISKSMQQSIKNAFAGIEVVVTDIRKESLEAQAANIINKTAKATLSYYKKQEGDLATLNKLINTYEKEIDRIYEALDQSYQSESPQEAMASEEIQSHEVDTVVESIIKEQTKRLEQKQNQVKKLKQQAEVLEKQLNARENKLKESLKLLQTAGALLSKSLHKLYKQRSQIYTQTATSEEEEQLSALQMKIDAEIDLLEREEFRINEKIVNLECSIDRIVDAKINAIVT